MNGVGIVRYKLKKIVGTALAAVRENIKSHGTPGTAFPTDACVFFVALINPLTYHRIGIWFDTSSFMVTVFRFWRKLKITKPAVQ